MTTEIQDTSTLPQIGSKVLAYIDRLNSWVTYTVVGYYSAFDNTINCQKVFVRIADSSGFMAAREVSELKML
ncbi:hypothetical protein UFOVP116_362 [uncultured Caudovirales phage]|uniref:Uncharacterized protein n=1 Tax=uncultured Caudovirales phage TaxID=2100421 RepID=A0A6J5L8E6_9CAUD|nr:hypothetical protein UFOVP116_362 [uncultured Caudovirales phage]